MLCLNWLSYFGRTRRASQQEYRRQIDQAFGQVIPSPWDDLHQGLVLGGESLWNRARELLDQAGGHEEIRWRRRADGDEVSRLIASLVAKEADRRVAIWLRVRGGGQRMTELAKEYGYRDGSGVHRVAMPRPAAGAVASRSVELTPRLLVVKRDGLTTGRRSDIVDRAVVGRQMHR